MEMSQRKARILAAVVELYIKTGEPVGSKAIQSLSDISVSSATIRNEMAELAAMGLLDQPHTSAGRVPTDEGYRYYVDNLMELRRLDEAIKRRIEAGISVRNAGPEAILERANDFLAELTGCATVCNMPTGPEETIKRVEMVPIGVRTAMIVVLTSSGVIKSRVCRSDCDLNAGIIEKFYNLVKSGFIGMPIDDIDVAMIQTLVASMGEDSLTMIPFVSALSSLAGEAAETKVMLGGQSNVFSHYSRNPLISYELLDFLRSSDSVGRVLSDCDSDLDIKIGSENKYRQLKQSSVITAQYSVDDNKGTIGIIGPTRIDYASLIPGLKYLSSLVGELLSGTLKED